MSASTPNTSIAQSAAKKSQFKNSYYEHGMPEKIGVLITNLGTPEAPTKQALRPYLKQFLSDPRVVEVPRLLWWFILNGIILNVRPKKSAEAYARVWTKHGSPLALYTKDQAQAIAKSLEPRWGNDLIVDWAMRYGNPSIGEKIQAMRDKGATKLLVLPMYPQYSAATTASTFDAIADDLKQRRWMPELRFIASYYQEDRYIEAVAKSIENFWQEKGKPQKLILSYHGVPLRYLHNGDPYHCQCLNTTRRIAERLQLQENEYMTCFQSRFGKEEWLRPYTDETLGFLPKEGIKNVHVVCPGFSADCLETIDEIGLENKHVFLAAGGESYDYIPALNADADHVALLVDIVQKHLQGWSIDTAANAETTINQYNTCPYNK